MKKLITAALFTAALFSGLSSGFAQQSQPVLECGSTEYYYDMLHNDPEFAVKQALLEQFTEDYTGSYIEERKSRAEQRGASSVVRIIPVVFHVFHNFGPENISKAQILSCIEMLNEHFRKLHADTVDVPAVFKPIAADSEIEFRLATLDPNGNCTDGIVRVVSPLTYNASNNIKAVSYWPSNKYLNIWVANTVVSAGSGNVVAGFSQFPGGNPLTDGIVMDYQYVGTTGTVNSGNLGRTVIHEIGHWFNLRHIWGDANCGNDFVSDTPTHEWHHLGQCPTHPFHVNQCGPGSSPNGEMTGNYMDYSLGICRNIFSMGQAARMNAALASTTSGRNNLWDPSNLVATGTAPGTSPVPCAPVAAFNDQSSIICEGTTLTFQDGSWNGDPDTWSWSFPGGTPSTSTDSIPVITYNTAGVYDVTLTVSNAAGTDTYSATGIITVVPEVGQYGIPYSESFENITFPGTEWFIENEDGGNTWEQNTLAAKTGITSVYLNNHPPPLNSGTVDAFITPTFNFQWSTTHSMTFELAFAARSSQSTDQLRVFASTTCGQLWSVRYAKSGTNLATAGIIGSAFFPTSPSQWATQSVSIQSSSYNNKPNVRFKFEFTKDTGNNLFIDDINIDGTVGLDELLADAISFNVFPNPVVNVATIDFTLENRSRVYIDVVDVLGRTVNKITEMNLDAGEYQFELPVSIDNGLYNVRIFVDGRSTSKKVFINR